MKIYNKYNEKISRSFIREKKKYHRRYYLFIFPAIVYNYYIINKLQTNGK